MSPCAEMCCGVLVRGGGRCPTHQAALDVRRRTEFGESDAKRGTASQRGYTSKWRKTSKGFLARHPLCAQCESDGRIEAAQVTDHIRPHRGDKDLFWDRSNWQPLCKKCHDVKTLRDRL